MGWNMEDQNCPLSAVKNMEKDGAFWGKAHFLDIPVLAFPTTRPSLLKLPEPPEIAVPAGGPVLNTRPSGNIL